MMPSYVVAYALGMVSLEVSVAAAVIVLETRRCAKALLYGFGVFVSISNATLLVVRGETATNGTGALAWDLLLYAGLTVQVVAFAVTMLWYRDKDASSTQFKVALVTINLLAIMASTVLIFG